MRTYPLILLIMKVNEKKIYTVTMKNYKNILTIINYMRMRQYTIYATIHLKTSILVLYSNFTSEWRGLSYSIIINIIIIL